MSQPFVGVQLGSHSVFDEGADHVLDTLKSTAKINALFLYCHAYQSVINTRTTEALADHGKGTSGKTRNLGFRWVNNSDEYFAHTFLRHPETPDAEYVGRDVFEEVAGPARERGMMVYGRMLEGHQGFLAQAIDNWPKILTVDVYGRLGDKPCWNNPDYRSWMTGTVENLLSTHQLDGFKYGAERSGPLSGMLLHAIAPSCFCAHCQAKGKAAGINVERAMIGFRAMHQFTLAAKAGERPVDGYFVTFIRLLLKYPEILAWEYLWHEAMESGAKQIYGSAKAVAPTAKIGWHVWHAITWDPFYQAEQNYAEMATYSDWIKPVVYHDVAGPRIKQRYIEPISETIFSDMTPAALRTFLFEILGYDTAVEAAYEDLPNGMSPAYVWREIRRCVLAVQDKALVYAGVGFDVPEHTRAIPSKPESVYEAAYRSFEAGAAGLLVSREYDEMQMQNLEAVGRAIDQAMADGLISDDLLF